MIDSLEEQNMQTNRQVQFNLGVFNIPTLVGIATLAGFIWTQSANRAAIDTKVDERLNTIESSRASRNADLTQQLNSINSTITVIPNLQYRITALESANTAINARIDRQTDAIGDLRDGINAVGTKIEVLTQRIEIALPVKKSQLELIPNESAR